MERAKYKIGYLIQGLLNQWDLLFYSYTHTGNSHTHLSLITITIIANKAELIDECFTRLAAILIYLLSWNTRLRVYVSKWLQ